MACSTQIPELDHDIKVLWDVTEDNGDECRKFFVASVQHISEPNTRDAEVISRGTLRYHETDVFESMTHDLEFLRGRLLRQCKEDGIRDDPTRRIHSESGRRSRNNGKRNCRKNRIANEEYDDQYNSTANSRMEEPIRASENYSAHAVLNELAETRIQLKMLSRKVKLALSMLIMANNDVSNGI